MRTKRHRTANDFDLADLRQAHRILIDICTRLSPSEDHYRAVDRAAEAVRECAVEWTRNENVFSATSAAIKPVMPPRTKGRDGL